MRKSAKSAFSGKRKTGGALLINVFFGGNVSGREKPAFLRHSFFRVFSFPFLLPLSGTFCAFLTQKSIKKGSKKGPKKYMKKQWFLHVFYVKFMIILRKICIIFIKKSIKLHVYRCFIKYKVIKFINIYKIKKCYFLFYKFYNIL